jgi:hypothetical protein
MANENVPRRERIATACLAGLLSDPSDRTTSKSEFARGAVEFADRLIEALDAPAAAPVVRCELCNAAFTPERGDPCELGALVKLFHNRRAR